MNNWNILLNLFALVGIIYYLQIIVKVLKWIKVHFSSVNPQKLQAEYGKNSYEFYDKKSFTGASDGIGKGYCHFWAKMGFKCILVARNKSKLENVKSELQENYPGVEMITYAADFTNAGKRDFWIKLFDDLKQYDISVIINNVGISKFNDFEKITLEENFDIINVNCHAAIFMTKVFLPQLTNRKNKSAIINVSSIAGQLPTGFVSVYSGTKAVSDFLSRALHQENIQNVRFFSHRCGQVLTNMTTQLQTNPLMINPIECATKASINMLTTNDSYGHGHIKHWLTAALSHLIPGDLKYTVAASIMKKEKDKEEQNKISEEKQNLLTPNSQQTINIDQELK